MARFFKKSAKGFTLVELLIVVAIIGVLSTIGVPTFRKMVTKAKKSEAKVALGGLFTVESAFYTEYNTYGNRLSKIGFEIDGQRRNYTIGFPSAACGDLGVAGLQPSTAVGTGQVLQQAYADYYGAVTAAETPGATNIGAGVTRLAALLSSGTGTAPRCRAADVTNAGAQYIASATGAIAPGISPTGPVDPGACVNCQDVWIIDQGRRLTNDPDGTN